MNKISGIARRPARAMGRISGFQFAESYEVLRMRI
jgi:hypothetical protein